MVEDDFGAAPVNDEAASVVPEFDQNSINTIEDFKIIPRGVQNPGTREKMEKYFR